MSSPLVIPPVNAGLSCPIDRLPDDVLSDIFVLCLALHGEEWRAPPHSPHATCVATLCCVSKSWNAIALATRALWTQLRISGPKTAARALVWAKRSRTKDLYVHLSVKHSPHLEVLLQDLEQASPRVAQLAWEPSPYTGCPVSMLSSLPTHVCELRLHNIMFDNTTYLRSYLSTCTRLKKLDLAGSIDSDLNDWMSTVDIGLSPRYWITLNELEELTLPPHSLSEQIRRYILTPRLHSISVAGGYYRKTAANSLEIRPIGQNAMLQSLSTFDSNVYLLVPEIESLTVIFPRADWTVAGPRAMETLNFCAQSLMCLGSIARKYPLPQDAKYRNGKPVEWCEIFQYLLPKLHTLNICNLPAVEGIDLARDLLRQPLWQRFSWASRNSIPHLKTLEIDGTANLDCLAETFQEMRQAGTVIRVGRESSGNS